jgi:CubicO group peptidase (beta-lactamase class C family)
MLKIERFRRLALVLLLIVTAAAPAPAQQRLPQAKPETVGMSSERLERIEEALQSYVGQGEIAGAATLVVRDGRIVARDSAGVMDLATGVPMRTDALFLIASMTKPVTSVAAMMLVEEGRMMLSDPISRYLPGFAEQRVLVPDSEAPGGIRLEPARRQITVRDLLTHRSGISYGFIDNTAVGDAYRAAGVQDGPGAVGLTQAENMARLAPLALAHHPGSAFRYGLSTDVLGHLVEVVSGMPLDEFFRRRIFAPLAMHDTDFHVPEAKVGRLAAMHTQERDGTLRSTGPDPRNSSLLSGGSGLYSTLDDYARFGQMLLNKGELDGVRILGTKTVELMTVSHTTDIGGAVAGGGQDFGLGFGVLAELGRSSSMGSEGNFGWGGAWGTTFWADPQERIVAVGMIQLSGGQTRFQGGFRNAVYQAVVE